MLPDGQLDNYDVNDLFNNLLNIKYNKNVIPTRLWFDGYHVSTHSIQANAS